MLKKVCETCLPLRFVSRANPIPEVGRHYWNRSIWGDYDLEAVVELIAIEIDRKLCHGKSVPSLRVALASVNAVFQEKDRLPACYVKTRAQPLVGLLLSSQQLGQAQRP